MGKQTEHNPESCDHFLSEVPFHQLLTGVQSSLHAFICGLLGGAADAGDVLQETNLVLWEKAEEFDRTRDFLPWALTFAHMQVLAYRKRQQRNRVVFDGSLVDTLATEFTKDISSKVGQSRLAALEDCMSKLPQVQRDLVTKIYAQRRTVRELAGVEGQKANTVAARLYRIRKRLADCVEYTLRRDATS